MPRFPKDAPEPPAEKPKPPEKIDPLHITRGTDKWNDKKAPNKDEE